MADFIGPMPYTPSAAFTPSFTASVNPPSGGLIGTIGSIFGTVAQAATSDTAQRAFTNVASAVNTWREIDVRNQEASTAEKLAMMAKSWLNPQAYPSAATAPYVEASASAPSNAGPVDSGAAGGLSPVVLVLGAVALMALAGRGR